MKDSDPAGPGAVRATRQELRDMAQAAAVLTALSEVICADHSDEQAARGYADRLCGYADSLREVVAQQVSPDTGWSSGDRVDHAEALKRWTAGPRRD